jgi:DNA-directed RNA polymerase specialized sigma24 family protein
MYLVLGIMVLLLYTKESLMGRVKDLLMNILDMYNQGWTISEIADFTGVAADEVESLLIQYEVL